MAKILILGGYGLLGSSLSCYLVAHNYNVMRQGRDSLSQRPIDPSDNVALHQLLCEENFDVVINLIASTDVDRCEMDCLYAYQANVHVVEVLANAIEGCSQSATPHLIHISTDQVYDGPGPHVEDDVAPCNVYALSKLAGEIAARRVGATILRTNFVGKSHAIGRLALTDWLVESLQMHKPITLFDDVLFSALHTSELCGYIEKAVELKIAGTFNVGCGGGISKAQFGLALAEQLNLDVSSVTVGRSSDIALKAKRPLDMRLDVTKFEQVFGVTAPVIERTIELVAREYMNA